MTAFHFFFPPPRLFEVVDMVRVPLVGEEKGKVAVDAVVESMVGLPFGTMEKPSFFGLPMRIRWELWVQLMGWTLEGGVLEAGAIYGHVEVGRDGHYFDLQAEPSTKEIVSFEGCLLLVCFLVFFFWFFFADPPLFLGQEAGFPRKKVYIYHQRNDVVRLEFRRKPDGVCVGYSNFPLKELKPNVRSSCPFHIGDTIHLTAHHQGSAMWLGQNQRP